MIYGVLKGELLKILLFLINMGTKGTDFIYIYKSKIELTIIFNSTYYLIILIIIENKLLLNK